MFQTLILVSWFTGAQIKKLSHTMHAHIGQYVENNLSESGIILSI